MFEKFIVKDPVFFLGEPEEGVFLGFLWGLGAGLDGLVTGVPSIDLGHYNLLELLHVFVHHLRQLSLVGTQVQACFTVEAFPLTLPRRLFFFLHIHMVSFFSLKGNVVVSRGIGSAI
jgi:hypothetical protein